MDLRGSLLHWSSEWRAKLSKETVIPECGSIVRVREGQFSKPTSGRVGSSVTWHSFFSSLSNVTDSFSYLKASLLSIKKILHTWETAKSKVCFTFHFYNSICPCVLEICLVYNKLWNIYQALYMCSTFWYVLR